MQPLPESSDPAPFLSSSQVASRLGISERTVRQLGQKGVLLGIRVGKLWRFDPRGIPGQGPDPDASTLRRTSTLGRRTRTSDRSGGSLVRSFLDLGFSQKEIAAACNISQSAVSRLLSNHEWNLSAATLSSLTSAFREAVAQRLWVIFHELDATAIEVSSDSDSVTDLEANAILDATVRGLISPTEALPHGVRAVLVSLGPGNYLIRVGPTSDVDQRTLLREVTQLMWRLRKISERR
jgi:excisionase family DNA binding protein